MSITVVLASGHDQSPSEVRNEAIPTRRSCRRLDPDRTGHRGRCCVAGQRSHKQLRLGYFCIWEDHDYQTNGSGSALVRFEFYIPNYGLWNYSGTSLNAANSASSLYNHSSGGNRVRIFTETNQNGAGYWIGPGSVRNNLATSIAPSGFNDDIESAYFETQLSAL